MTKRILTRPASPPDLSHKEELITIVAYKKSSMKIQKFIALFCFLPLVLETTCAALILVSVALLRLNNDYFSHHFSTIIDPESVVLIAALYGVFFGPSLALLFTPIALSLYWKTPRSTMPTRESTDA